MFGKKKAYEAVRNGISDVYPRLWKYCLVLSGNRANADDLAQAACLRALEKSDRFEPGTHLDRWLFRLTQRLWIDETRKQVVRTGGGLVPVEDANLVDETSDPEQSVMLNEVIGSVMQLPEAQRATVMLVYVEGYSYRDAAMILDIPVGTVMSRLAVARSKLATTFDGRLEAV